VKPPQMGLNQLTLRKKAKFFGKNYRRKQPTLTSDQEELSNSKVRGLEGNSEDVSVVRICPLH